MWYGSYVIVIWCEQVRPIHTLTIYPIHTLTTYPIHTLALYTTTGIAGAVSNYQRLKKHGHVSVELI